MCELLEVLFDTCSYSYVVIVESSILICRKIGLVLVNDLLNRSIRGILMRAEPRKDQHQAVRS